MYYGAEEQFFTLFFALWPMIMLFSTAISIGVYVLQSFGLYSMANNTGMKNPWLAWIPFCNSFVLGSMADRYNLNAHNKQTKYRIILVVAQVAIIPVTYILTFFSVFSILMVPTNEESLLGAVGGLVLALLIIFVMSIATTVLYLVCYHKMFMDYEPSRATGYTVAAFFGFGFIPLFISRNNVPVGIAGVCNPKQPKYDTANNNGQNSGGYHPGG